MDSKKTRIFLILLLFISAIADTATFLYGRLWQFEINPLYLMTKSIVLVLLIKFLVISFMIYKLYSLKINKSYLYGFLFCFGAVYLVIGQSFGAYSNYNVMQQYQEDPINTIPMSKEEAYETMSWLSLLFFYLPMFISLISFWFFERIFLEKERAKLKKKAAFKELIWGKKRKSKRLFQRFQ